MSGQQKDFWLRDLFDAAFTISDEITRSDVPASGYFLSGSTFTRFEWGEGEKDPRKGGYVAERGLTADLMPGLPPQFYTTSTNGYSPDLSAVCGTNGAQVYLFKDNIYVVYDFGRKKVQGVPKKLFGKDGLFKEIPESTKLTAAVAYSAGGDHKGWLMSGNMCWSADFDNGKVDGPVHILDIWPHLATGNHGRDSELATLGPSYALPSRDGKSSYVFRKGFYAELDPQVTQQSARNVPPAVFAWERQSEWPGMFSQEFQYDPDKPVQKFYPVGQSWVTSLCWSGGGGGGGGSANGRGGQGGGGQFQTGVWLPGGGINVAPWTGTFDVTVGPGGAGGTAGGGGGKAGGQTTIVSPVGGGALHMDVAGGGGGGGSSQSTTPGGDGGGGGSFDFQQHTYRAHGSPGGGSCQRNDSGQVPEAGVGGSAGHHDGADGQATSGTGGDGCEGGVWIGHPLHFGLAGAGPNPGGSGLPGTGPAQPGYLTGAGHGGAGGTSGAKGADGGPGLVIFAWSSQPPPSDKPYWPPVGTSDGSSS